MCVCAIVERHIYKCLCISCLEISNEHCRSYVCIRAWVCVCVWVGMCVCVCVRCSTNPTHLNLLCEEMTGRESPRSQLGLFDTPHSPCHKVCMSDAVPSVNNTAAHPNNPRRQTARPLCVCVCICNNYCTYVCT